MRFETDNPEELMILPACRGAYPGGHGKFYPLRAYRVYRDGQMIYPRPEDLEMKYRLVVRIEQHEGGFYTDSTGQLPTEYVYTIETALPCYVKEMDFMDAPEGQNWSNDNVYERIWSEGINVSRVLGVKLPCIDRYSWADHSTTSGRAIRSEIYPSEGDTTFITVKRTPLDTLEEETWLFYYTPSTWYMMDGTYPSGPVYTQYNESDERLVSRCAQVQSRSALCDTPFPSYWMLNRVHGDDEYWLAECHRLYVPSFLNPTRLFFPCIFFHKFYNGRVAYLADFGGARRKCDRQYTVIENTNPAFDSVAAWKKAIGVLKQEG